ncbi:asparaginase [Luteibaculum oceani]|uniref:asparaginase n=1 Tax=Luteibaculum oceani TaxID=1294296 RepID=A0A5C6V1S1_9FLAO|nr:asparaginase [Luteibaculum oceani]TXC78954.1 asparaginase [Luteibaculum oceani]
MTSKIALLYTGGTIGMSEDSLSKRLVPVDFGHLFDQIPELKKLEVDISFYQLWEPIDSSDMQPHHWVILAEKVEELYQDYDGFVILHGTDTMAYTASALSFMLKNLSKPVILTGSQLPIGTLRTDGKENIISAVEIAAAKENGKPVVPEVCIYFEYKLLRGNRSSKLSTEHFDAFKSPNYPALAEAGVKITYNYPYIDTQRFGNLELATRFSNRVSSFKLYPGFDARIIDHLLEADLSDAIIIEGYGSGNIGKHQQLRSVLQKWVDAEKLLLVSSQCVLGSVFLEKYESGAGLKALNAISTEDLTFEASLTKIMLALGSSENAKEAGQKFKGNWAGEQAIG